MAWLIKRGDIYYIRWSLAGKKRKISTNTHSFQLAKEKLRQFEAAEARGDALSALPSNTPITTDDLDLASGAFGVLRIRAKTIEGESWQPKTKRNRADPISSRLRHYLDKWRLKRTAGTWLFPSPQGRRWDCDNFSSDLRAANESVKPPWGCLDFRHTFGSQLAMKGESLYKISALMGNSPEICRRHYAALLPEALVESVEFPAPKGAISQVASA